MCVGMCGVIMSVSGLWAGGGVLCVVDVLAGGQGGSEDRTSLRGVAVNP